MYTRKLRNLSTVQKSHSRLKQEETSLKSEYAHQIAHKSKNERMVTTINHNPQVHLIHYLYTCSPNPSLNLI